MRVEFRLQAQQALLHLPERSLFLRQLLPLLSELPVTFG
jgi:hypothetical protein